MPEASKFDTLERSHGKVRGLTAVICNGENRHKLRNSGTSKEDSDVSYG